MMLNRTILVWVAAAGMLASTSPAAHLKLFVLTGQSNSLGTTNGGEADPTSGTDAADPHVPFFWHNVVNASTTIGTSGGVFTTLQDQQGGVYAGSATHWGPEIEFARTLYRSGVRDFGIIKASRGGGGNTFWLKGSADDHMYVHVTSTVAVATADLTANGHTYEIVGLLYLQGESDGGVEITEAGTRLKTLTDNLRVDLPNAAALHTVAAGTTAAGGTSSANQAATAAATSYIDFFPNLDLQDRLSPDNLHLNKAGKIVVGNRYAQTFLNAGIVSRQYGNLVFIGDSITQGGNGLPSYRYQVFKNLATAGVPTNATTGYAFVGSLNGAYLNSDVSGATPDVNGQTFENNHDGHWGWRAMWENGRVALPTGRRSGNRGEGTILNWTGQASPQEYVTDGGTKDFPDLTVSGTGVANPYTAYTPDTASIMIGINESTVSSATQLRDDIGSMIDQLRGSNPNVRIHLNQLLYSDNVAYATVDAINALLPQLVIDKNAASSTSPVWLVHANDGFVPSTHTYDNTHPNAAGETQVGDILSGSLGIIETPYPATGGAPVALEERAGADLGCLTFEGSDIYNTGSYASGWSASGGITPSEVGDSDLRLDHPGGAADTLDGTNTGWSDINDGVWTYTARLKFDANPDGFVLWLGTGTHRILIEVYGDRTQDLGANSFNVSHNNLDGQYHTFKVTHDPSAAVYHVWRDGVLLTAAPGAGYDQTGADERLLMGDYTSGSFGDGFDVTIDAIDICRGYEGNEIYNGTSWINGWGQWPGMTKSLVDTSDLRLTNPGAGGTWLEGTNTEWSDGNDGYWTFETRLKFNANPNGFVFWLGTGNDIVFIEIYSDRTQDTESNVFNVSHNNIDGQFHIFRVGHDPNNSVYHVWRDGERITPVDGAGYDSSSNDERMILGDYTGGTFGNGFDVTIDYVRVDTGNAYLPPGADADGDGMTDLWEDFHFGDLVAALPGDHDDGDGRTNLEEYIADTNPLDGESFFGISTWEEIVPGTWRITVQDTSARRDYTLQASGDIGLALPWPAVPGQGPLIGNGGDLLFSDSTVAATSRFFAVEVAIP